MKPRGPVLPTRVAHAGFEEHRFCGFRVFGELAGNETAAGMLGLAIAGRRLSEQERGAIDDLAVAITMADPRIWPLKIPRLVSAYGRAATALAAANLYQDAAVIGPPVVRGAAELLACLRAEVAAGRDAREACEEAVLQRRRLDGFGVPLRPKDERLVALTTLLQRRGLTAAPHFRLMETLAEVARRDRQLEPNIASGAAALGLDLGLTPSRAAMLTVAVVQASFLANAIEGAEQAPECLRSLPLSLVEYVGVAPRVSPRAAKTERSQG